MKFPLPNLLAFYLNIIYQALLKLHDIIIQERQPGEVILQNKIDVTMTCQYGNTSDKGWAGETCEFCTEGWTGGNCTYCDVNFGPPEQCDTCVIGWAGENCDSCAKGWTGDNCDTCADGWIPPTCDQICDGFCCCNHSNCHGCIQDGLWEGLNLNVRLTFSGKTCSELAPGR